jgi:sigma-B regulation protein RsbU (phosphoserine phosphatase)
VANSFKRLFDLYTSDLSADEITRLIKRDANEVFEFYSKDIPKPDPSKNKIVRGFILIRSLFNVFILKFTPARRIFYLAALLFFIVGYSSPSKGYLILSFVIINLLIAFELADKLSAKSELDVARKIQFDVIPRHSSSVYNYQISSYYEPARDVGGDYFDFIDANDKTYIIVGDISGKGMAAALYMVRVQSIINLLLDSFSQVKDIIINLKKYFSKSLRREYFLTISIASIDKSGEIALARAGHPPVYWFKSELNEFEIIYPQGIGIGLNDKGIFEKTLEQISFMPKPNDIIFFYTDGVNEAMNARFEQFGEENIKRIIKNNYLKSAEEIKSSLLKAINFFRGNAYQNDDITFVILKAN